MGWRLALGWRPAAGRLLPGRPGDRRASGRRLRRRSALLLAGTLRAEAVLAVANLVWVLLLAGGGVVIPPHRLGRASILAALLPSGALGDGLRAAAARPDGVGVRSRCCWGGRAGLRPRRCACSAGD